MSDRTFTSSDSEHDAEKQWLELELKRIRSEANAARLEAQAVTIELALRRFHTSHVADVHQKPAESTLPTTPLFLAGPVIHSNTTPVPFQNWDDVRRALQETSQRSKVTSPRSTLTADRRETRFDTPSRPSPHFAPLAAEPTTDARADETNPSPDDGAIVATEEGFTIDPTEPEASGPFASWNIASLNTTLSNTVESQEKHDASLGDVFVEPVDGATSPKGRKKPLAMIVSTVMHVAVLWALAAWTLSTHVPRDQVSLSASASVASETAMETFTLEANEPTPDVAEPTETETEYELSPLGEVSLAKLAPDIPAVDAALPAVSKDAFSKPTSDASMMSLKSDSKAAIQFCGVEGGGNHFVYLVDSSGSMKDGFVSARNELIRSIDLLTPEQRFYVIFFDAEPDYMRLRSPDVNEPTSVYATPENKAALKRWALRIQQDRGENPFKVLEFAMTLRPDVIFLLSDGEFPQRVEDLLKQKNRIENLFGESRPVSIVHTIGYFSKEGETRMKRIAEQNGGRYRYVPRP